MKKRPGTTTIVSAMPVEDCKRWNCEKLGGHHYGCAGYLASSLRSNGEAVTVDGDPTYCPTSPRNPEDPK